MDEIDMQILRVLSDDASVTATTISRRVRLSIPAVNKRIQRLKKEGVIKRFTIVTDGEKVRKPITAFALVCLKSSMDTAELLSYVKTDPDILECFAVTGEYDCLLKMCARDVKALEEKLAQLKTSKGVIKSYTMLTLTEHKFSPTCLP